MKDAATELSALAERVEQAEPHMQGVLLDRAWDELAECSAVFRRYAVQHQPGFDNNAGKFAMAMEARAYESAAMMLVPEGYEFAAGTGRKEHMEAKGRKPWAWCATGSDLVDRLSLADTPALALTAAALRAHAAIAGEG